MSLMKALVRALHRKASVPSPFGAATGPGDDEGDLTTATGGQEEQFDQVDQDSKRRSLYKLYEQMERDFVIKPALDIFADEAVMGGSVSYIPPFTVTTDSKEAARVIELMDRTVTLNGEPYKDFIRDLCRDIAQFGDVLWENVCSNTQVVRFVNLLPQTMKIEEVQERWQMPDGTFKLTKANRYAQERQDSKKVHFMDWQITHFRGAQSMSSVWGYRGSLLWAAQGVWRLLHYAVEAMAIDRVYSSHHARKFKIDTGDLEGMEAWKHVWKVMRMYRRRRRTDPTTGKLLLERGFPVPEKDVWVPAGPNNRSEVEELYGARNRPVDDIDLLLLLLCVALACPPSRLGILKDVKTRATITRVDISFAKNVNWIRLAAQKGLSKAYRLQMSLAGLTPGEHQFKFIWPPISTDETARVAETLLLKAKICVLLKAESGVYLPDEWFYRSVLDMTEEDIAVLSKDAAAAKTAETLKKPLGPLSPEQWKLLISDPDFAESFKNLKFFLRVEQEREAAKDMRYHVS